MSTIIKAGLVLAISVFLFLGMTYVVEVEPLDYIRTYFYNPSIVNSVVRENQKDAEIIQTHINNLQGMFFDVLNEPAMRSSFLHNQSADDIFERSRILGILLETVNGLQMVQFVDSNGIRIHFSTSTRDIISQGGGSTAYRNYNEDTRAMPFTIVSAGENDAPFYTMDDSHDRIIFSYPFFDSMDIYRGTALFTLSVRSLAERLISEGRLMPNDDVSVIRVPPGIVFGSPDTSKAVLLEKISAVWGESLGSFQEHITLDSEDSGVHFALITAKTGQNLFFGRLINNTVFSIPDSMKLILNVSMFLTFFLTLFFILNFKPNPAILVRIRLEKLRSNLFEQLYINKSSADRAKWILELEQRRDGIRQELKNKLKIGRALEQKIDDMIDVAWDELLDVIKSGSGISSSGAAALVRIVKQIDEVAEVGAPEEEVDEIEEVEEIEEIGDAEEVDDIEEIEEIEEVDEIEEAEEIEEIGDAEEVDDIEEIEEINEIEEIKEAPEKIAAAPPVRKGLLARLENIARPKGLLALASRKKGAPKPKGLLAKASFVGTISVEEERKAQPRLTSKGLLKLAREIEFGHPVVSDEMEEELDAELDIVSPFDSMFSDLEITLPMASD